ncbi:MAG: bifunctional 4-hydroxy-3-methylbut-2-enyl diphosphate reductase/30S ribosomal protein S1 [[Eubacterium] sulci]|nr:bifunctional 4-hydroxy-3-methylbut-2-enyl diphosphate reductase/30S ribosomal protein S1 [[Eubacterium] sulci]
MEIIRADNSGFCFGVKKALETTQDQIKESKANSSKGSLFTCGPLIHNKIVTSQLEYDGVRIIKTPDEAKEGDTIIVRSHGEPKAFYDRMDELNLNYVDTTCPFVSKIHTIVNSACKEGKKIIIIGDENHQEVIATNGWCDNSAYIINSPDEVEKVESGEYLVVCQTTIRKEIFESIIDALEAKGCKLEIKNTICNATSLRQDACQRLAKEVDAMVIIGDKQSSNTKKLYEIAKKHCNNSFFAENISDLPLKEIQKYNKIGVAAGASTPESVIKEVIANMSETEKTTMADFMDEIDASLRLPHNGEIVDGKVHQVSDREVIVNLGCKKDGILPVEEVTLEEGEKLTDLFQPGDEIQAKVVKTDDGDGSILLSKKKLEISKHWAEINEAHENKTVITVKVLRAVNGGVIAAYKEVTGFIPMSQLSDRYVENADEFIGQTLDVLVTRVDAKRNRALFSHKAILLAEKQKLISGIWDSISVGDIVEGTVMRFTDYGAFVDIGGIDGLLHISEISWGKLKHPQEVLETGQTVQVKVLSMNQEKGKISLGLKQITPEPWSIINDKYQVGEIVSGKVVQIKEYGAFVELEPGLDGLVHISEVAHKRVSDIAEELQLGQLVDTKILDIDVDRKRISLSIKAAAPAPEVVEEEVEATEEA